MSKRSLILQEAKPRPSVTIMYILQVQVIFDAIKESCHVLILSLTCKGLVVINSLLLMYIDTLWFDILVSVSLHCGDYYNCAHTYIALSMLSWLPRARAMFCRIVYFYLLYYNITSLTSPKSP